MDDDSIPISFEDNCISFVYKQEGSQEQSPLFTKIAELPVAQGQEVQTNLSPSRQVIRGISQGNQAECFFEMLVDTEQNPNTQTGGDSHFETDLSFPPEGSQGQTPLFTKIAELPVARGQEVQTNLSPSRQVIRGISQGNQTECSFEQDQEMLVDDIQTEQNPNTQTGEGRHFETDLSFPHKVVSSPVSSLVPFSPDYYVLNANYEVVSEDEGNEVVSEDESDKGNEASSGNKAINITGFPTADSIPEIVSFIKSVMGEVYGPLLKDKFDSIDYESQDEYELKSILELFSMPDKNTNVQEKEIINKEVRVLKSNCYKRRKVQRFAIVHESFIVESKEKEETEKKLDTVESLFPKKPNNEKVKGFAFQQKPVPLDSKFDRQTHFYASGYLEIEKVIVEDSKPDLDKYKETTATKKLNEQKISFFFPKLMTKIALDSKSNSAIEKSLKSENSLFILNCKARLAWKFNNIDASALFKLTALEVKRGNLNLAFVFYKNAGASLSNMIFCDKIFSFISSELYNINEVLKSAEQYFFYREINEALMKDDPILPIMFDKADLTKLDKTEIDGANVINSIDFSMEDLQIVATKFL